MRSGLKLAVKGGLVFATIIGVAVGVCVVLTDSNSNGSKIKRPSARSSKPRPTQSSPREEQAARKPWNTRDDGTPYLYGDGWFDDSGYFFGVMFTGEQTNPSSLEQISRSVGDRAQRGVSYLQGILKAVPRDQPDSPLQIAQLHLAIGGLFMYDGNFTAAKREFEAARDADPAAGHLVRVNYEALLGVVALRRGEVENCVACRTEESCIFPLSLGAVHQSPGGSREAMDRFTNYLAKRPEDIGVRWLLNIAAMTLGKYPDGVPPSYRIPLEPFRSKSNVGRFVNVAARVGLDPSENMAGGSILDDFTGDGLLDVFTSTSDPRRGARLFVNRGDGTFEERSQQAGLGNQVAVLNCNQADYDNDGDLDIYLMRGGWERPFRPSLLRNDGNGKFTDVTLESGVGTPIASQSAAWADYDNDGYIDLFVAGEYIPYEPEVGVPGSYKAGPDPRNLCRLYHNERNGTFIDVAASGGVLNQGRAKGAAWGDYDQDGHPDLFVSNCGQENCLYHNNGDGTFTDVAPKLRVTEPIKSFSCWFFDYDNDGRQDIFVNGFSGTLCDIVRSHLDQPTGGERPRLYHNEGPAGFRDVTWEAGLDRVLLVMGSNFGDIDNDGYLDMYLGTGQPACFYVVPNVLFRNVDGKRFEDVTLASGTGHLQKGHGISFGDWDRDGDGDIFLASGGATPGDMAHNVLFQNPGHGNHWISVKLVGTRSNRAAIGAEVRADLKTSDGKPASRYRVISSGSSFGGNSLAMTIGLGRAQSVTTLEVHWPTSGIRQILHDVPVDQAIEITEGHDGYRVLNWSPIRLPAEIAGAPL
jgi:hypothetical protein